MLEGLRRAQQNWLGKIIITFLFGILIISFAMVFVQRDLSIGRSDAVITAGGTKVTADALKAEYERVRRQIQMQREQPLTPQEAKAMQLDRNVLATMVQRAVLDESARKLGLAVSDDAVRQSIFAIPAFQSQSGFDRTALDRYLANMQIPEGAFVAQQRADILRNQLMAPITVGVVAPKAMQDFAGRLVAEQRDVSYYVLTDAAAGAIPEPTDAQIEATYQDNKAQFRAPEYRAFEAIAVLPDALVSPDSISDEDARKAFSTLQASGALAPEKRTVQQIVFPNEQQAKDAVARLKAGKVTFDALAQELKAAPETMTIGTLVAKGEILDPNVADAAFALAKNQVSDIVSSPFGPTLVRTTEIQATPFDDVKAQIKERLARERAQPKVNAFRDSIEEMMASARPFADIAKEQKLPLIDVKAIDKTGLDMNGQPIAGLPEPESLTRAVFASDIGVDNAPLNLRNGGSIWYHVTNVTPSRERALTEVRAQVIDIWKRKEAAGRLEKMATEQLAKIKNAADLANAAAQAKTQVATAQQLTRVGAMPTGLPVDAVDRIFATNVGVPGSLSSGKDRVIFLVTSASVPATASAAPGTVQLSNEFTQGLGQDLMLEYIGRTQKDLGVTIDQSIARSAFGGEVDY